MAISSSGPISIGTIRQEFGFLNAEFTSISGYYRGGSIVPISASSTIPTSGTISLSNFYGSSKLIVVTYELIGGGGAGGAGEEDGADFRGTFGGSGGSSTLTIPGVGTITAAGGNGGENAGRFGLPYDRDRVGGTGAGTAYGPGGVGAPRNTAGGNAPLTSYGAGGGGGGGDQGSFYDSAGSGGSGGGSGVRRTGTFNAQPGMVITFTIGNGGEPSENAGTYVGGFGQHGYLKISYPTGRVGTTVVERIIGGSITIS